MAVTASRVSVTTTATLLASVPSSSGTGDDWGARSFLLKNVTATAAVFLGPAGVTAANGFQWDSTDPPLSWSLEPGESLYGVVASTGQTVHVAGNGR